jgi:hypothetical protein
MNSYRLDTGLLVDPYVSENFRLGKLCLYSHSRILVYTAGSPESIAVADRLNPYSLG